MSKLKYEKYLYYNEGEKQLTKFRVDIDYVISHTYDFYNTPIFYPEPEQVHGYDLSKEEQYWRLPEIPDRLKNLETVVKRTLKYGEQPTPQQLIILQRAYLKQHKKEYSKEIKWIKSQWYYRLFGYWFMCNGVDTYIDGWYYSYLTTWKFGGSTSPDYRESDRRSFMLKKYTYLTKEKVQIDKDGNVVYNKDETPKMIETTNRTLYGNLDAKARRRGETHISLSVGFDIITLIRDSEGFAGIISFDSSNAYTHYQQKLLPAFKEKPFWFKPIWTGTVAPQDRLEFRNPQTITDNNALGTIFDAANTFDRRYFDGKKLYFIDCEEEGKTTATNVIEGWMILKPCLSLGAGGKIIGFALHPSTVEEMEKSGGANYKRLADDSMFEQRNDMSGQTESGLIVNFVPADDGLYGFIDKFGASVRKNPTEEQKKELGIKSGAYDWIISERSSKLANQTIEGQQLYRAEVRKFPLEYRQCWLSEIAPVGFNHEKIEQRIYELEKEPPNKCVNFYRIGGLDGDVEMRTEPNGRWIISYDIPTEWANKRIKIQVTDPITNRPTEVWSPQSPRFVIGADTYKFDRKSEAMIRKKQKSDKLSNGGAAALRIRDLDIDPSSKPIEEWQTFVFYASYEYRMPNLSDFCEDVLNACVYMGGWCFPEMELSSVEEHFVNRGYAGYLLHSITESNGIAHINPKPGYFARNTKQKLFGLTNDYIEQRINKERIIEYLKQTLTISNLDEMRYNDRFAAHAGALIGHESLYLKFYQSNQRKEQEYTISSFYRTFSRK